MKLEIYRMYIGSKVEYLIYLNYALMGTNIMERLTTPIEDTDKVVINMVLHNLANNMDEAITRVINGDTEYCWRPGNCIYSSTDDKVLKLIDIKLKMKEIEEDFKDGN